MLAQDGLSVGERLTRLSASFIDMAGKYPRQGSSTRAPNRPWAPESPMLESVPNGTAPWPKETVLAQFQVPILCAGASELHGHGFELELHPSGSTNTKTANRVQTSNSQEYSSNGMVTPQDVCLRCMLCMCLVKTSNLIRDPKRPDEVPIEWRDTYFANIMKHVTSTKHHLALYQYTRGHLHGMRYMAKLAASNDGNDEGYGVDDTPNACGMEAEYERLLKYVRWRERLLMDIAEWELNNPDAERPTNELVTPASLRALKRFPGEECG